MHADEVEVSEELVRELVSSQFPQWRSLDLRAVEPWGTDNAIFRLGEDLVVRLPRIGWAVGQVHFEDDWLPRLGRGLAIELPAPMAVGEPQGDYPFVWAIHRWLHGEGAGPATIEDPVRFAGDLARIVGQLQQVDTSDAPLAKNRARPLAEYDVPTRAAIEAASHLIDADVALAQWEESLAAPAHAGDLVWVHGDLEGNCLVRDGRLSGLVDWGSACAGDPAVDVQVVWSPLFTPESRAHFLAELDVDEATLSRSRGAAINQACAALPYYLDTYPLIVERSWHKLAALGIPRL